MMKDFTQALEIHPVLEYFILPLYTQFTNG